MIKLEDWLIKAVIILTRAAFFLCLFNTPQQTIASDRFEEQDAPTGDVFLIPIERCASEPEALRPLELNDAQRSLGFSRVTSFLNTVLSSPNDFSHYNQTFLSYAKFLDSIRHSDLSPVSRLIVDNYGGLRSFINYQKMHVVLALLKHRAGPKVFGFNESSGSNFFNTYVQPTMAHHEDLMRILISTPSLEKVTAEGLGHLSKNFGILNFLFVKQRRFYEEFHELEASGGQDKPDLGRVGIELTAHIGEIDLAQLGCLRHAITQLENPNTTIREAIYHLEKILFFHHWAHQLPFSPDFSDIAKKDYLNSALLVSLNFGGCSYFGEPDSCYFENRPEDFRHFYRVLVIRSLHHFNEVLGDLLEDKTLLDNSLDRENNFIQDKTWRARFAKNIQEQLMGAKSWEIIEIFSAATILYLCDRGEKTVLFSDPIANEIIESIIANGGWYLNLWSLSRLSSDEAICDGLCKYLQRLNGELEDCDKDKRSFLRVMRARAHRQLANLYDGMISRHKNNNTGSDEILDNYLIEFATSLESALVDLPGCAELTLSLLAARSFMGDAPAMIRDLHKYQRTLIEAGHYPNAIYFTACCAASYFNKTHDIVLMNELIQLALQRSTEASATQHASTTRRVRHKGLSPKILDALRVQRQQLLQERENSLLQDKKSLPSSTARAESSEPIGEGGEQSLIVLPSTKTTSKTLKTKSSVRKKVATTEIEPEKIKPAIQASSDHEGLKEAEFLVGTQQSEIIRNLNSHQHKILNEFFLPFVHRDGRKTSFQAKIRMSDYQNLMQAITGVKPHQNGTSHAKSTLPQLPNLSFANHGYSNGLIVMPNHGGFLKGPYIEQLMWKFLEFGIYTNEIAAVLKAQDVLPLASASSPPLLSDKDRVGKKS